MTYSDLGFGSPTTQYFFDLNGNTLFKKDDKNYIYELGVEHLNTLGNTSLLDIFLSKGNIVEPHYHQNASELVYCISGNAAVSLLNPFTKQILNFNIKPGQVANVPKAWWHYEIATSDNTHLLAIFDAPTPEVILGSDILRLTPANIWAHSYCLDEKKVKETFAPIKESVFIGPPSNCSHRSPNAAEIAEAQAEVHAVATTQSAYPGPSSNGFRYPQSYVQGNAVPQAYGAQGLAPQGLAPQGYAGAQEFPFPQRYAAPQGYALPQGYSVPQGYGAPQGYAVPQGYSAAPPSGYEQSVVYPPSIPSLPPIDFQF